MRYFILLIVMAAPLFGAAVQRSPEAQSKSDMPQQNRFMQILSNLCLWEWQKEVLFGNPEFDSERVRPTREEIEDELERG